MMMMMMSLKRYEEGMLLLIRCVALRGAEKSLQPNRKIIRITVPESGSGTKVMKQSLEAKLHIMDN